MSSQTLHGRGIVITRPREHAERLSGLIRNAGGEPILFPTIEIVPPDDSGALREVLATLDRFHMAIFISPTAASRGYAMVRALGRWPEHLRIAAVGAGTAEVLARQGQDAVIHPGDRADSEALAALPEFTKIEGRSILIFRGQGGREQLRSELEARGAHVEYAECYRRIRPRADARPLLERWASGGVDAVSIMSAEGLENFFQILGSENVERLRRTPVFVPHPRIATAAEKSGVRNVILTGRGDEEAATAMSDFFATV